MVRVLEQYMVVEIARIGELRLPNEACGVILPYPVNNRQIIELPNRSKTPHDEVFMNGEDLVIELEFIFGEDTMLPENLAQDITFWHTHPQGHVGPSSYDLKNKAPVGKHLVVSLGDPPLATWF